MEELTPFQRLKKWAEDENNSSKIRKDAISDLLQIGVTDEYAIDVLLPIVKQLQKEDKWEIVRWANKAEGKIECKYKKDWKSMTGEVKV